MVSYWASEWEPGWGFVSDEASAPASAPETVLGSEQWTADHWVHWSAWTKGLLKAVTKVALMGQMSVVQKASQTELQWADKMAHWSEQRMAVRWAAPWAGQTAPASVKSLAVCWAEYLVSLLELHWAALMAAPKAERWACL